MRSYPPIDRFFSKRWAAPLSLLLLSLLIFLAYYKTIHGVFQLDDEVWITNNPMIRNLANLPAMLMGPRGFTTASLAINFAIGGLDVRGYHLVNIAIHILNAILVYILIARTLVLTGFTLPRARLLSLSCAAIFSLHPVQTQAVAYIVQRMEIQSALFCLLALVCFTTAAEAEAHAEKPLKKYIYYALIPLIYIAAFYSKEIAITLPALILLYDAYFVSSFSPRKILEKWPLYAALFVLGILFVVKTVAPLGGFSDVSKETAMATATVEVEEGKKYADLPALQRFPTAGFGVPTTTPFQYFLTESNVILYYYALLILPINQNIDYDFPVSKGLFELPRPGDGARLTIPLPWPALSILIHLSLIVLALCMFLRSYKKKGPAAKCASFFIIWFFIILSPTSSFIPIIDVIFEHRLYMASLGYAVILTLILNRVFAGKKTSPENPAI
ncbi:MAG: hypothetical protein ACE5EZ_03860 [Thermodesulfobacteriota bacterium]